MAKRTTTCQFCFRSKIKCANFPGTDSIWNYIYHQNVRETLLPSMNVSDDDVSSQYGNGDEGNTEYEQNIPQLTFTFSQRKSKEYYANESDSLSSSVLVCSNCKEQLGKLDKLHKELETIKEAIQKQVKIVEEIRMMMSKDKPSRIRDKVNLEQQALRQRQRMDLSMAGSTVGKENILRTLQFLSQFCGAGPGHVRNLSGHQTNQKRRQEKSSMPSQSTHDSSSNEATLSKVSQSSPQSDENNSEMETDEDEDRHEYFDVVIKQEPCDESDIEHGSLTADPLNPEETDSPPSNQIVDAVVNVETENSSSSSSPPIASTSVSRRTTSSRPQKTYEKVPCSICDKLISKISMTTHLRVHSGEKPFECEFCGKCFSQSISLTKHRRIHTGQLPYECDLCQQRFREPTVLKSHKRSKHKIV